MKKFFVTISLVVMAAGVVMLPVPVSAVSAIDEAQKGVDQIGGKEAGNNTSLMTRFRTFVNVALFLIGALSVVMIVVGGFRYVASAGNTAGVASAKNTVVYAVVGVVVALLAYAIINFVTDALVGSGRLAPTVPACPTPAPGETVPC